MALQSFSQKKSHAPTPKISPVITLQEQGHESGGEVVEVQTPIGRLRVAAAVELLVALVDLAPEDLNADGGEDVVDQEEQEASENHRESIAKIVLQWDFIGFTLW